MIINRMKLNLFLSVLCACALIGCGILQLKTKFCDGVPEDGYSIICEIAHAVNTEPEEIAMSFKLANLTGLSIPLYTAQQAMQFFDDMTDASATGRATGAVTYKDLISWALDKYGDLPPTVQALIIIADEYYDLDLPEIKLKTLSGYDWDGIDRHIAKQKALIVPFLLTKEQ